MDASGFTYLISESLPSCKPRGTEVTCRYIIHAVRNAIDPKAHEFKMSIVIIRMQVNLPYIIHAVGDATDPKAHEFSMPIIITTRMQAKRLLVVVAIILNALK